MFLNEEETPIADIFFWRIFQLSIESNSKNKKHLRTPLRKLEW